VRLALERGWEHEVLSSLHIAAAVPSPQWRNIHAVEIYCSMDGGAWGFVMLKDFSLHNDQSEQTALAVRHLRKKFKPAEFDMLPNPDCHIKYARDLDIQVDDKVLLGLSIDEAMAQMDMAWKVLQLVNWGNKSADEAIRYINASELQELQPEG
jgi:hypothetical protein